MISNMSAFSPLAEFLFLLSESEKQLLVTCSTLLEHPEFNFRTAAKKIAPGAAENISVEQLQAFLKRELDLSVNTQETKDLVQYHSPDLNFPNFFTSENLSRLLNIPQHIQRAFFTQELEPQDLRKMRIDDLIARILKKELHNQRKVKLARKELIEKKEFSVLSAFEAVFDAKDNELSDVLKIENFLSKYGIISNDFDISMIASRLDRNKDGAISFEDFHLAVLGYPSRSQQDKSAGDPNSLRPAYSRRREDSFDKSLSPHDSREQVDEVLREYERNMSELRKGLAKSRNEKSNSPSRVSASRRRLYKNFQFNQEDDDKTLDEELLLPLNKLNESMREQEEIMKGRKTSSGSRIHSREASEEITREEIIREYSIGKIINKDSGKAPSVERSLSFSESKTNRASSPFSRDSARNSQDAFKNLFAIRSSRNMETVRSSTEKKSNSKENEGLEKTTKKSAKNHSAKEKELVALVDKLINIERNLEVLRVDLTMKKNFNVMEVFKFIDVSRKSTISVGDFEKGFKTLDIQLKIEDVEALYRRFDKDMAGLLRFSDFAEIFKPKAADTGNKRPPTARINSARLEIGENLRGLLREIVNACLAREEVRDQIEELLKDLKLKSILEIFNLVQEENIDLISLKEFREIMTENSILAEKKELSYLIKKYEK